MGFAIRFFQYWFPAFVIICISSAAQAQKLGVDLRLDYRNTEYSAAAEEDGQRDYYKFYLQTARLNLSDTLFEDVSYRIRWRISGKNQGNVTRRDATNSGLDMAYVTTHLTPDFTLTVGKFLTEVGGYEGAISGPEIYVLSEANAGTSYLNRGVHLTGADANVYYTGAKITYVQPTQYLAFHVANNNTAVGRNENWATDAGDSLDNGAFDQDRSMVGLVYNNMSVAGPEVQTLMSVHYSNPGQGTAEALYLALGGNSLSMSGCFRRTFYRTDLNPQSRRTFMTTGSLPWHWACGTRKNRTVCSSVCIFPRRSWEAARTPQTGITELDL